MVVGATQLGTVAAQQSFQERALSASEYRFGKDLEIAEEPEQAQPLTPGQFNTTEAIGRLDMKYAAAEFFQIHARLYQPCSNFTVALTSPNPAGG